MPTFEVDYTYYVPESHITTVIAKDVDEAEENALAQLSETLDPEIVELEIDAIRELKQ